MKRHDPAKIHGVLPLSGMRKVMGFVLIEVMLGVTIFAVGVLALGQSVNHCVMAETAKNEDRIARTALSNRLAEIEGKAVDLSKDSQEELKGIFKGITLKQRIKPAALKNEKKEDLGISEVSLEVVWKSGKEVQSKALSIYVQRPQ